MKIIEPAKTRHLTSARPSDLAINGWVDGLAAGLAMLAFLLLTGLSAGPGLVATLTGFSPAPGGGPLIGFLAHLSVASIYGLLFGWGTALFLRRAARAYSFLWLMGIAYGLALWVIARGFTFPDLAVMLQSYPPGAFLGAHLVYGLTLGLLTRRHY